jgi:hypothetical protein
MSGGISASISAVITGSGSAAATGSAAAGTAAGTSTGLSLENPLLSQLDILPTSAETIQGVTAALETAKDKFEGVADWFDKNLMNPHARPETMNLPEGAPETPQGSTFQDPTVGSEDVFESSTKESVPVIDPFASISTANRLDNAMPAFQVVAKKRLSEQLASIAGDNPAVPAIAAKIAHEVVGEFLKMNGITATPEERSRVETDLVGRLTIESAASKVPDSGKSANLLESLKAHGDAETIREKEAAILDGLSKLGSNDGSGDIQPETLIDSIVAVSAGATEIGSKIGHDTWFATSITDTVRTDQKQSDVGGVPGIRGRPFMISMSSVEESGSQDLKDTVKKNNEAGVGQTMLALVDIAKGITPGNDYVASVKNLPNHLDSTTSLEASFATTEMREFIGALAKQLKSLLSDVSGGESIDWTKYPLAQKALSATHDRYLQTNGEWAPKDQKVPFQQLSEQEQLRDIPVLMATLYGVAVAGGLMPPVDLAPPGLELQNTRKVGISRSDPDSVNLFVGDNGVRLVDSVYDPGKSVPRSSSSFELRIDGQPVPFTYSTGSTVPSGEFEGLVSKRWTAEESLDHPAKIEIYKDGNLVHTEQFVPIGTSQ